MSSSGFFASILGDESIFQKSWIEIYIYIICNMYCIYNIYKRGNVLK